MISLFFIEFLVRPSQILPFVFQIFDRESVLEHFVRKVQCRGLFSTHYHRLAVDYLNDPKVFLVFLSRIIISVS